MRTRLLFLSLILSSLSICPALAQQHNSSSGQEVVSPSDNSPQVVHAAPTAARHFYRLDFVLREAGEDKLLSQRSFIMNISADPQDSHEHTSWSLRSGTRVPLHDPNGTNYVEVGVDFDLSAKDADNALQIEVTSAISSIASDSAAGGPAPIRSLKVKAAVLAPLGKATTVFTAEDPSSRHQFELQVTAVRAK
jgi:hypothetical protein